MSIGCASPKWAWLWPISADALSQAFQCIDFHLPLGNPHSILPSAAGADSGAAAMRSTTVKASLPVCAGANAVLWAFLGSTRNFHGPSQQVCSGNQDTDRALRPQNHAVHQQQRRVEVTCQNGLPHLERGPTGSHR